MFDNDINRNDEEKLNSSININIVRTGHTIYMNRYQKKPEFKQREGEYE